MNNKEGKWLSEVIDCSVFKEGKLNLITAPCGSGKTTAAETLFTKELLPYDYDELSYQDQYQYKITYLCDTRSGLEAFRNRGQTVKYRDKKWKENYGIDSMTYATWAKYNLFRDTENVNDLLTLDGGIKDVAGSIIVCDELQSVIKWSKIEKDTLHKDALNFLHQYIKYGATVISITATPDKIKQEFKKELFEIKIEENLRYYSIAEKENYFNLDNLIENLPQNERGLIYVPHITQQKRVQEILNKRGIKNSLIFSLANTKYQMTAEELEIRKQLLETEKVPDDIQVLIINASTETGINIKSNIDYVVVHTSHKDTQTQVIGRVRHDVKKVYLYNNNDKNLVVPSEFLNKPLYKEDKNKLAEILGAKNNKNRLLKWSSIKKMLIGYDIIECRKDNKRCDIIKIIK